MQHIENLDDLLDYITNTDIDDQTMSDLPTFGGDMPSDTTHVWSWDEERLLIGTCSEDYEIVTRKEWGYIEPIIDGVVNEYRGSTTDGPTDDPSQSMDYLIPNNWL
tara:strand:- start:285 stop:602 length:318 start_codon:yes stop_codon:yes gene_type:complete